MAWNSRLRPSLKSPFQWIGVSLITLFFLPVFLAPRLGHGVTPTMQNARAISLLLAQYATDHHGAYPPGKSSTEVFQKLLDENYLNDPSVFFDKDFKIPGKIKATSHTLKPENVCWDITIPITEHSPDSLPIVFSTGYKIDYVPGGNAIPLFPSSENRPFNIVVTRHSMTTYGLKRTPSGIATNFISSDFDAGEVHYQQLTPDGPLAP